MNKNFLEEVFCKEELSRVEQELEKVGIKVKDENGNYKTISEVLSDIKKLKRKNKLNKLIKVFNIIFKILFYILLASFLIGAFTEKTLAMKNINALYFMVLVNACSINCIHKKLNNK